MGPHIFSLRCRADRGGQRALDRPPSDELLSPAVPASIGADRATPSRVSLGIVQTVLEGAEGDGANEVVRDRLQDEVELSIDGSGGPLN